MKPKPAPILLICPECSEKIRTLLLPGANDITALCPSDHPARLRADYDGLGIVTIYAGTIEKMC